MATREANRIKVGSVPKAYEQLFLLNQHCSEASELLSSLSTTGLLSARNARYFRLLIEEALLRQSVRD
jgi:hypothetical protein